MKLDHRVRMSQRMIRRAFLDLLKKKPVQNITVKEVCEEAGIHRGTFYAHYKDLYDLLHQIEDEMTKNLESALEPLLSCANTDPLQITTAVFQRLQENADLCSAILGNHGEEEFVRKLLEIGREHCVKAYSKYYQNASPFEIEYFYVFVSSGCIGLIRKWVDDGMLLPASTVAQMAESLMLHGITWLNASNQ
ncbi:MAG: TetR/AcrR family transcriptional regulator [Lachnospirales bacterium]